MPRLLACKTHRTVDVLPDFNSDVVDPTERASRDIHLKEAIERHFSKYGSDPNKHVASPIIQIDESEMALLGDNEQMRQALFDNRLEEYLRGEREDLKDQAIRCWNIHNKPAYGLTIGCPDYRTESRVVVKTKGRPDSEQLYLCDFCPYQVYVDKAKNDKRKF